MSSICNQSLYIDCNKLLKYSKEMLNYLTRLDRLTFGEKLLDLNLEMISQFCVAYKVEQINCTIEINGVNFKGKMDCGKISYINKLIGYISAYEAIMNSIFKNCELVRIKKHRYETIQTEIAELFARIDNAAINWRRCYLPKCKISCIEPA